MWLGWSDDAASLFSIGCLRTVSAAEVATYAGDGYGNHTDGNHTTGSGNGCDGYGNGNHTTGSGNGNGNGNGYRCGYQRLPTVRRIGDGNRRLRRCGYDSYGNGNHTDGNHADGNGNYVTGNVSGSGNGYGAMTMKRLPAATDFATYRRRLSPAAPVTVTTVTMVTMATVRVATVTTVTTVTVTTMVVTNLPFSRHPRTALPVRAKHGNGQPIRGSLADWHRANPKRFPSSPSSSNGIARPRVSVVTGNRFGDLFGLIWCIKTVVRCCAILRLRVLAFGRRLINLVARDRAFFGGTTPQTPRVLRTPSVTLRKTRTSLCLRTSCAYRLAKPLLCLLLWETTKDKSRRLLHEKYVASVATAINGFVVARHPPFSRHSRTIYFVHALAWLRNNRIRESHADWHRANPKEVPESVARNHASRGRAMPFENDGLRGEIQ